MQTALSVIEEVQGGGKRGNYRSEGTPSAVRDVARWTQRRLRFTLGGIRQGFANPVTFEIGLKRQSHSPGKGEGTGLPELGSNDGDTKAQKGMKV